MHFGGALEASRHCVLGYTDIVQQVVSKVEGLLGWSIQVHCTRSCNSFQHTPCLGHPLLPCKCAASVLLILRPRVRCSPACLFPEQVVQVVPKELEGRMQLFSRGALDKVRSLLRNQMCADGYSNRQSQPSVTAYVPPKPPAPDTLKHT